ncbi:MAG: GH92 family glycosyl hydrolase [Chitinophagales bacterium]|nr:GH92 family glycosyl hydrolase [Chitinophagales bacterium]
MTHPLRKRLPLLCLAALCLPALLCAQLQYVDPFIGTGGHGHTFPGASAPFGLVQLSPDTRPDPGEWDGCSGYHASDSILYGFSHTHLSGTGVPDYCDIQLMPFVGGARLEPEEYRSPFLKKNEKASPGYYSVYLHNERILCEMTATERVGLHRYTFPPNRDKGSLLLNLVFRDKVQEAHVEVISDTEVAGYRYSSSWAKNQRVYFYMRFSQPVLNSIMIDMAQNPRIAQPSVSSPAVAGVLTFKRYEQPLVVAVGISGTSMEGAKRNLDAECPTLDFDGARRSTEAKWQQQLGKIQVEGGSDAQKKTFYTALYHTMLAPNIWNDVDGAYRGRDDQIHMAKGHNVYTVFSLWDTYRAANPLYTLLEPRRANDFVQTFLRQYEQGGLLPVWELSGNETECMIGNHAIPVIADTYHKGIRDFDANLALEAMLKSANSNRYGLPLYRQYGFVPSDQEPESVSKTLEYAYDDWCIAQMAQSLGRNDVYEDFTRRSQSYKNLFDPASRFFRARNRGAWHTPFDPFEVNFNYTEANAWQYRFSAPQDLAGLSNLFGGPDSLVAAIDALFSADSRTTGRQQADITGLIGQYVQGNEPSHHIAYLYAALGRPDKTQQRVRQLLDEQYRPEPDGLSGNEDCGQMSAWYVFSALGFYPLTPGTPEYTLGTPLFEKVSITLDNGKKITLEAPGASKTRCYVSAAQLNGRALNTQISHSQLLEGGTLRFEMSATPPPAFKLKLKTIPEALSIVPAPFVQKGERVFRGSQQIILSNLDPQAKIYTLILKPDQTFNENMSMSIYEGPITVKKDGKLYFFAKIGDKQSAVLEFPFKKLDENLRVVRYAHAYNPQYTGHGEQGLVDGLRGAADFRTGDWQGFEGKDLDVVLDLGKKHSLNKIGGSFLQDENAWIFFPKQFEVEISDDGQNFTPAGTFVNPVSPQEKGLLMREFFVNLEGKKARFVRVRGVSLGLCPPGHKGAGNPSWVFCDEILVE